MTCQGKKLDTSKIGIAFVSNTEYKLNLEALTLQNGFYVLTVHTQDIIDNEGFSGTEGKLFSWIQNDGSGVREIYDSGDIEIKVVPNPVENQMFINGSFDRIDNLFVHDIIGIQMMHLGPVDHNQGVDTSTLPTGFYILTIETERGNRRIKIIKI